MNLPIDARNAPFKPKYIDEETPMFARWMIFGTFPDGTVGICSGDTDVFDYMPIDKARRIVEARHTFVDVIMAELNDR